MVESLLPLHKRQGEKGGIEIGIEIVEEEISESNGLCFDLT